MSKIAHMQTSIRNVKTYQMLYRMVEFRQNCNGTIVVINIGSVLKWVNITNVSKYTTKNKDGIILS